MLGAPDHSDLDQKCARSRSQSAMPLDSFLMFSNMSALQSMGSPHGVHVDPHKRPKDVSPVNSRNEAKANFVHVTDCDSMRHKNKHHCSNMTLMSLRLYAHWSVAVPVAQGMPRHSKTEWTALVRKHVHLHDPLSSD